MSLEPQTIELTEFQPGNFPPSALSDGVAYSLWLQHRDKLEIKSPGFQTGGQWVLTAKGWVGHIPVDDQLRLLIRPKVRLANLFRMLEYAYRLEFLAEGDLVHSESIEDFYQRLAVILSRKVLERTRRGIYRDYTRRAGRLPYVRGKLQLESMSLRPWEVDPDCRYSEHTADIEENQLLTWTLHCIARSGLCRGEAGAVVRKALHALQGNVSLRQLGPQECIGRLYNRLNDDYRPMHSLCRFFLEHSGPGHQPGNRGMIPFLVNMSRLFEMFVAEWLLRHLPDHLQLQAQERVEVGQQSPLCFVIDLVLIDRLTRKPICVLDTKYKGSSQPSTQDVSQVIAYAEAIGCSRAILVYPDANGIPFHAVIGRIEVDTIAFKIGDDLKSAGESFLSALLGSIG